MAVFCCNASKESVSGSLCWCIRRMIVPCDIDGLAIHEETRPERFVARHFLIKPKDSSNIWHIDENMNNNHYKNLIYVSSEEYELLQKRVKTVA